MLTKLVQWSHSGHVMWVIALGQVAEELKGLQERSRPFSDEVALRILVPWRSGFHGEGLGVDP